MDQLNAFTDDLWTLVMLVLDFGKFAFHMPLWIYNHEPDGGYIMEPSQDSGIRVRDVYRNEGTVTKPVIGRSSRTPRSNYVALMRYAGMDGRIERRRRYARACSASSRSG